MKERIIQAVLTASELTMDELKQRNRARSICIPRQMLCYLLSHKTSLTDPQIAEIIGLDRTTVIHSVQKVKENLEVADKITLTYFRKVSEVLEDKWIGAATMPVNFKETLIG